MIKRRKGEGGCIDCRVEKSEGGKAAGRRRGSGGTVSMLPSMDDGRRRVSSSLIFSLPLFSLTSLLFHFSWN